MAVDTLKDLYLAELQEARSFEAQVAKAAGELAGRASDPRLRQMLEGEGPDAARHGERLGALLEGHGAQPGAHTDQTMQAILSAARDWADGITDPAVRDAALLASLQRVQHYEIAALGALAAWARQEGLTADVETLQEILDEEKAADARLTALAEDRVNAEAA
jgi:ferritin-like metal-binding protein YciE